MNIVSLIQDRPRTNKCFLDKSNRREPRGKTFLRAKYFSEFAALEDCREGWQWKAVAFLPMAGEGEVPEHCPGTTSEQAGKASACAGCPNQVPCVPGRSAARCPLPATLPKGRARVRPLVLPAARQKQTACARPLAALRTSNCAPRARPPSPIRTSRTTTARGVNPTPGTRTRSRRRRCWPRTRTRRTRRSLSGR